MEAFPLREGILRLGDGRRDESSTTVSSARKAFATVTKIRSAQEVRKGILCSHRTAACTRPATTASHDCFTRVCGTRRSRSKRRLGLLAEARRGHKQHKQ